MLELVIVLQYTRAAAEQESTEEARFFRKD